MSSVKDVMKKTIKLLLVFAVFMFGIVLSSCEYLPDDFKVTLDPEENIVVEELNVDLNKISFNAIITLKVIVPEGKEVDVFSVDGNPVELTDLKYRLTVTGNHVVKVTFKDIGAAATVNLTLGNNLSISGATTTEVNVGDQVTIVVDIPEGKVIDKFMVDGANVEITGNQYVLTVTKAHEIEVTFKEATAEAGKFTVTLGTGLSTSDPLINLAAGAKVKITITVPEGQEIQELKVDGVAVDFDDDDEYELTVSKNHSVEVVFKESTISGERYTVTLGDNLVADLTELTNLKAGTEVTITVKIPEGKEIKEFKVDGLVVEYDEDDGYELEVTKNHTVEVRFRDIPLDLSKFKVTLSSGLSANLTDLTKLEAGTEVVISVAVPNGKEVLLFTVDGVAEELSNNKYKLTVSGNHSVVVHFKDAQISNTVFVKFETDGGVMEGFNLFQTVEKGGKITEPSLEPEKPGYKFLHWSLNGQEFDFTQEINEPITLYAKYTSIQFEIKYVVGNEEYSEQARYGSMASDYPVPNVPAGKTGVWTLKGVPFDFNTQIESNLVLVAAYYDPLVITQSGSGTNQLILEFSEDIIFLENISDKLNFLSKLLPGFQKVVSVFNLDKVSVSYENKKLIVTVGEDFISREMFKIVDFDNEDGNGVLRIPVYLGTEGFKTQNNGIYYSGQEINFHLKLSVPLINNKPDYTKPVTTIILNVTDYVSDLENDIEILHQVKFMDGETQYGEIQEIPHRGLVNQPEDPVKANHTFAGWFVDAGKFDFEAKVKFDLVLQAKWVANNNLVTVKYNTKSPIFLEPEVYQVGDKVIEPEISLINYKLVEWQLNNQPFDFNTPLAKTGEITLIAVWEEKVVPITIELHNGEDPIVFEVPHGTFVELVDMLEYDEWPQKEGYLFAGYEQFIETAAGDHGLGFYAGVPTTIDVLWLPVDTTVTFNCMDGRIKEIDFNSDALYSDGFGWQVLVNEVFDNPPTREGYILEGWYTAPDYKHLMDGNLMIGLSFATTYYAKWVPRDVDQIDRYTIEFETYTDEEIDSVEVPYGAFFRRDLIVPVREGYQFEGWYLDEDFTMSYRETVNNLYIDSDITLYAKWEKIGSEDDISELDPSLVVTITFVTYAPFEIEPIKVKKGEYIARNIEPYIRLEDYYFEGWWDEGYTKRFELYEPLEEDITLYAKWVKKHVFTVILDDTVIYQGSHGGGLGYYDYSYDNKNRYEYYLDRELTIKFKDSPFYYSEMGEDITLYAKYITNERVTFDYVIHFTDDISYKISKIVPIEFRNFAYMWINKFDNYQVEGLYLDQAYTIPVSEDEDPNDYIVDGQIHIYAKLLERLVVTIKSEWYGYETTTNKLLIEPNQPAELLFATLEEGLYYWRRYYEVEGFYLDQDFTVSALELAGTTINENLTLYVKWVKNDNTIILNVDTNGVLPPHKIRVNRNDLEYLRWVYHDFEIVRGYYDSDYQLPVGVENTLENGDTIYVYLDNYIQINFYIGDSKLIERSLRIVNGEIIPFDELVYPICNDEMIVKWTWLGEEIDISKPFYSNSRVGDLRVYYGPIAYYTIQFKDNDVIDDEATIEVYQNQIFEINHQNLPYAKGKENHTFAYWANEDGTIFNNRQIITGDLVLEAFYVSNDDFVEITLDTGDPDITMNKVQVLRHVLYEFRATTTLTREGYKFLGWYKDGEPFTIGRLAEDTTLVAEWREAQTHRVTINKGKIGGDDVVLHIPEGVYIDEYNLENNYAISRRHETFEFRGYYIDGERFYGKNIDSDITLFMKWRDFVQYTVNFYVNDFDWRHQPIHRNSSFAEDEVEFPECNDHFIEGQVFSHWEHNGVRFTKNTIVTADIDVHAVFVPEVYTIVHFNTKVDGLLIEDVNVVQGLMIEPPQQKILREGHRFLYWAYEGEPFDFENTPIIAETTLEAVWEKTPTYKVTIDLKFDQPLIVLHISPLDYDMISEQLLREIFNINPQYPDYQFLHFLYNNKRLYEVPLNQNIDLETIWLDVGPVTITYVLNEENEHENFTFQANKNDYLYTRPEPQVREGMVFIYWYETDENVPYDWNRLITGDITLYPHYIPERIVTVSFDTGDPNLNLEPIKVQAYQTMGEQQPRRITRENKVFEYWSYNNQRFDFQHNIVTEDITLTAVWSLCETFLITYNYINTPYGSVVFHIPQGMSPTMFELISEYHFGVKVDIVRYQGIKAEINGTEKNMLEFLYTPLEETAVIDMTYQEYEIVTVTYMDGDEVLYQNRHRKGLPFNDRSYRPEIPKLEKEGYDFIGWKYQGTNEYFDPSEIAVEDITVYAHLQEW
jgi:uncharacterized repeat protein (TIGR02543 family)